MPEPTPGRPVGWWRQFVFAGETDAFPKADAIRCIELILAELGIRTDDSLINFASDSVTDRKSVV